MAEKKNPLLAGIISLIPTAINTISSLVKDKKEKNLAEKKEKIEPETTAGVVVENIKEALTGNISSKRVLNIAGTAIIVSVALGLISSQGLTKLNLSMLALGILYSLGMSFITYLSEKK